MVDLDAPIDQEWLFSHQDLMLVTRDGLGDQIVAAGLACWMSQHVRRVYVTCRQAYWPTINWLYRNVDNVIPVGFSPGANWNDLELLGHKLGAQLCRSIQQYHLRTGEPWYRAAYSQYHLDYGTRFSHFPLVEPGPLSHKLFDRLVTQPRYRVVHNNSNERASYDIDLLQGKSQQEFDQLQTIYVDPSLSNNLFDWILILQRAEEIQLVASSVYCLCQQISSSLQGQVIFHHKRAYCEDDYTRDIQPYHPNWKWIDYPVKQWQ
jgi:hypothetical protein